MRNGAKTETEAIAEIKEEIEKHHKGEWRTSDNPTKCKEECRKNGKIHVYKIDGSQTFL
jgi:hypothetical protein